MYPGFTESFEPIEHCDLVIMLVSIVVHVPWIDNSVHNTVLASGGLVVCEGLCTHGKIPASKGTI